MAALAVIIVCRQLDTYLCIQIIYVLQFHFRVEEQISSILDICRQEDGKACVKVFYDVSMQEIL